MLRWLAPHGSGEADLDAPGASSPAGHVETGTQRGSVTAEFALALPAVVLVLLVVLSIGMAGATQVALEDAARAAARELARGESATVAEQSARRTAGAQVSFAFSEEGGYTRVELTHPIRVLGVVELDRQHTASAAARTEHLRSPP